MAWAILKITDGTKANTVDLLARKTGWHLKHWKPANAQYKDGGVWVDNKMSNGRKLKMRRFSNAVENMEMVATSYDFDSVAVQLQKLKRLFEDAADYWEQDWNTRKIYVIARAQNETNTRYATIYVGSVPEDADMADPTFTRKFIADGLNITFEHDMWQDQAPGSSACLEVSGAQVFPYAIEYDGYSAFTNCGSDASIDDLPSAAAFTMEAWVKIDPLGADPFYIASKKPTLGNTGWWFKIDDVYGLNAKVFTNNISAFAYVGANTYPVDGEWHHVAMTYDDTGDREIHLWLDGVEVAVTSTAAVGVYASDAATDLCLGANNEGTEGFFSGYMCWSRISNIARYVAGFTPQVQCAPPPSDVNTLGLWPTHEGEGNTLEDISGWTNHGTITDGVWADADCRRGRDATCTDEVYIANKHNKAQITHAVYYEGNVGDWSDNLIGTAKPTSLLAAVIVNNDAVYFGSTIGPFCSLVFDILTAATWGAGSTAIWEYCTNAVGPVFSTLVVRDNTNADGAHTGHPFDTTGVKSVHWVQMGDWVEATIAGVPVSMYWVRMRVTNVGAGVTPPTQQNREIYTITWPYIEIVGSNLFGDIPALLETALQDVCEITAGPYLYPTYRYWMGLRSLSRGEDFTAYINISDVQNPVGLTLAGTFGASSHDVTGRVATYTTAGAGAEAMAERASIDFGTAIINQYRGVYRAMLIVDADIGTRFTVQLGVSNYFSAGWVERFVSQSAFVNYSGDGFVADLGLLYLPPSGEEDVYRYKISIKASAAAGAGANTLEILSLVLLPVDEWVGDFASLEEYSYHARTLFFRVDSALNQKDDIVAQLLNVATGAERDRWLSTAKPFEAKLQTDKRLWIFNAYWYNVGNVNAYLAQHEFANQIEHMTVVKRYFSLRGAR